MPAPTEPRGWAIAISLALVAGGCGRPFVDCGPPTSGQEVQLVVDSLTLPENERELVFDLDGSGHPENGLGWLISFLGTRGVGAQETVDQGLADGSLAIHLDETASNLDDNRCGSVTIASGVPLVAGGGVEGAIDAGRFDSDPPSQAPRDRRIHLELPLLSGVAPLSIDLSAAHLQMALAPDHASASAGQLNGAIRWSDFEREVLVPLAQAIQASATPQDLMTYDLGDRTGHPCVNPDGSQSLPGDGRIGACELESGIWVYPDVQLFDEQGHYAPSPAEKRRDSLSFGIGFTAVAR